MRLHFIFPYTYFFIFLIIHFTSSNDSPICYIFDIQKFQVKKEIKFDPYSRHQIFFFQSLDLVSLTVGSKIRPLNKIISLVQTRIKKGRSTLKFFTPVNFLFTSSAKIYVIVVKKICSIKNLQISKFSNLRILSSGRSLSLSTSPISIDAV